MTLSEMGSMWGRYVDEVSCGVTSFVTGVDPDPPMLGSIGFIEPSMPGLRFHSLLSSYKGNVNVRATYQLATEQAISRQQKFDTLKKTLSSLPEESVVYVLKPF